MDFSILKNKARKAFKEGGTQVVSITLPVKLLREFDIKRIDLGILRSHMICALVIAFLENELIEVPRTKGNDPIADADDLIRQNCSEELPI